MSGQTRHLQKFREDVHHAVHLPSMRQVQRDQHRLMVGLTASRASVPCRVHPPQVEGKQNTVSHSSAQMDLKQTVYCIPQRISLSLSK